MWVDLWPLETDLPIGDLYHGTRKSDGMPRCSIMRHGGGNPIRCTQKLRYEPTLARGNLDRAGGRPCGVDKTGIAMGNGLAQELECDQRLA